MTRIEPTAVRIPAPGFADPVADAQQTFRAALDALARPTLPVALDRGLMPPGALTPTAGALVLALCDDSTPVWLDPALRSNEDVTGWIAFHTGAPVVDDPTAAAFAILIGSDAAPALTLSAFAQGTDEAPHTSTTLIVIPSASADGASARVDEVSAEADGMGGNAAAVRIAPVTADGPGFPEPREWSAPWLTDRFLADWSANHGRFPRGVDILFAEAATVTGLPRTTSLVALAEEAR